MRIRIDLSYDGLGFRGWATQPGHRTVQETIEQAIAKILRLPTPPMVQCAGRTDAGVHARAQVAHVDLPDHVVPHELGRRLRSLLPEDLMIHSVTQAPPGFDARFAALERRYAYRISDDPAGIDPIVRNHVVPWGKTLDVDRMNATGELLLGQHDFAAFCRKRDGATTIRTLLELSTVREGGLVTTTVRADAFCHSMVRALMGALTAVGDGRDEPAWAVGVLQGKERDSRVRVMPAHGLVLEEVVYPDDAGIAGRVLASRRRRDET